VLWTPNLCMMRVRWFSTVLGLMNKSESFSCLG
jgi:hypothetical protein